MATKSEVKADIKRLVGTLTAHKGWFTREHDALKRLLDALLDTSRPSSEDTLALARNRFKKLQVHSDNVDIVIREMCELTPEDSEHHMARGESIAEQVDEIELLFARVMDEAEERRQAQLTAAAAAAIAGAGGAAAAVGGPGHAPAQRRVREAIGLKPAVLDHKAGHVKVREWLLQFKSYYHASHMEDGDDEERHGYFFACLDYDLNVSIRPKVDGNAVVFQPADVNHTTSLEAHLWRYFDTAVSIFVRRHHLFTMEFSRGETDSHFNTRMLAQARECDLAHLGINELLAQLQMSKTPNAVLKDEYLKTDGSLAAITRTFTAYETRTSAVPVGAVGASGGLNAMASGSQGRSSRSGCSYCGGQSCKGRPTCSATGETCLNCQRMGHFASVCRQPKQARQPPQQKPLRGSTQQKPSAQQNTGNKKGKKKVTEYKKRKASGHAPIEQDEAASALGSLYSVEEVDEMAWSYGGHPTVTGGRPTPHLRVSVNKKSAGYAVPDTGASWTVVPQSLVQQHRLRVDTSIKVTLRAANGQSMPVSGRTTFLLSALGRARTTSAEVQALVCPGTSKIYVGWEALIALGVIPAAFPEPSCAEPLLSLDARHQEPSKRNPPNDCVKSGAKHSPTPGSEDGDALRRVRMSTKTSVGPETSKCRQEAPSRQRVATGGKPSQVDSCGKATPQVAARRKQAGDPLVEAFIKKYRDVFSEDVKPMDGPEMTIKLKEGVRPKRVLTARPCPAHLQKGASEILQMAIRSGVIVQVNQPTEWISPAFFVPKATPGKARLVTDYTWLNRFVDRPVHPFPSPLDVIKSIDSKSTIFAKLDATSGYFQVKLDEKSSLLTTFLLPEGKFRYVRAPMGLSSSSDEFCQRTDEALAGAQGVVKVVDDILVQAKDRETLRSRLEDVLQRCRKHGITLSADKFVVGSEVTFAGFLVSASGVRPDPAKVRAIAEFPVPRDVTSVRSFLGLANQLGIFVSDLAAVTDPLRKLLKKNITWIWTPDHQAAFEATKRRLAEPLNVAPFDLRKPTELWTDASSLHGLGYALVQEGRLIQAGSRSLLDAETRYAVVELEATAVAWAIKACRHYLIGCPSFVVKTDHRPLVGLFVKDMVAIDNPRLVRIRESVLGYVFTVEHVPGIKNAAADALSRYPLRTPSDATEHHCVSTIQESEDDEELVEPGIADLVASTTRDEELQLLKRCIRGEDVPHAIQVKDLLARYRPWSDRISVHKSGLLLVDCRRIIVPKESRSSILSAVHQAHPGLQRSLSLARRHYVWPGMRNDIAQAVSACDQCQTVRQAKPVETPFLDRRATRPMESISVDLCESRGRHFLVAADRFSGYPWVARLTTKTTGAITAIMEKWFDGFGWPQRLGSDGGPQFRHEFEDWCTANSIIFELSSARNPASNGLAEAAVKRVKHLLEKIDGPSSLSRALLALRNTPMANGRESPAQALFKQDMRVPGLPTVSADQPASTPTPLRRNGSSPLRQGGRHGPTTRLATVQRGEKVRVYDPDAKRWSGRATVLKIRRHGASVWLRTDSGRMLVRNQRFLKPLANAQPRKAAECSSGRKMVTRSMGKKMESTKT
jgi:transposase InsO family protein